MLAYEDENNKKEDKRNIFRTNQNQANWSKIILFHTNIVSFIEDYSKAKYFHLNLKNMLLLFFWKRSKHFSS